MNNFYLLFFFLMIRRPPRSTLFPTRRSSDLRRQPWLFSLHFRLWTSPRTPAPSSAGRTSSPAASRVPSPIRSNAGRSEEHTSELQSQSNLVCRLLLEKKNNNKHLLQRVHTYK